MYFLSFMLFLTIFSCISWNSINILFYSILTSLFQWIFKISFTILVLNCIKKIVCITIYFLYLFCSFLAYFVSFRKPSINERSVELLSFDILLSLFYTLLNLIFTISFLNTALNNVYSQISFIIVLAFFYLTKNSINNNEWSEHFNILLLTFPFFMYPWI